MGGNHQLFRQPSNSGFVEGLNNKLKVLKRRSYGFQSGASFPTHLPRSGRLSPVCGLTTICGRITVTPNEPHYLVSSQVNVLGIIPKLDFWRVSEKEFSYPDQFVANLEK